jgi:N6-L-threonylcarbamoyladenine synthase
MVYVLNKNNEPLMPCSERKSRLLLKQGKAVIYRKDIFTIKLINGSYGYKQHITLGIDCGSKHIGISATTERKELFSANAELRNDIVKLLSDRKSLRRNRRYRKTRYRKPRFDNRRILEGWLAPSIRQKIDLHVRIISLIHKLLPVKQVNVEVAAFDIQKIKNPDIEGVEYQIGEQLDSYNVREYVLFRDNHICQNCKGKSKDDILQVHHIESRKTGGNAPNNLVTLCKTCHEKYHSGEIMLNVNRGRSFRDASAMSTMRWFLYEELKNRFSNVRITYGYITKYKRIKLGLPKEHYNDAYCIADNLLAKKMDNHYLIRFIPRHSRILHVQTFSKGGKRRSASAPYWLNGGRPSKSGIKFTRFDKVKFNNVVCFISGSSNGSASLRDIQWNKINGCKTVVTVNKLELVSRRHGSMLFGELCG